MADDAGVLKQLLELGRGVARDLRGIEIIINLAIVLALAQHRDPRQAGLAAFQGQQLEQGAVVPDWPAPLGVMIFLVERVCRSPPASCLAVRAGNRIVFPNHARKLMPKDLSDLKVCIFDVFGTVVDWRGSLIEDLPKLGKKYGLETDWTSFADDWRGLYQPQMTRVRKGELPWTRIDDLHKEAFEMLLKRRSLKHPGE